MRIYDPQWRIGVFNGVDIDIKGMTRELVDICKHFAATEGNVNINKACDSLSAELTDCQLPSSFLVFV